MSIFLTKVLLATDGSEEAEMAALRAVELPQRIGSGLDLVHVGFALAFLMGDPETGGHERALYEEIEGDSREPLRKLFWRVKAAGGNLIETHLGMGMAGLKIVVSARKRGAGLIVMGRRGLRSAIGGSVSDAVVRNTPCPVLVARSCEGTEGPPSSMGADRRHDGGSCGPWSVTRAGIGGPTRRVEGAVAIGRTKREVPRKRKTSTAHAYA